MSCKNCHAKGIGSLKFVMSCNRKCAGNYLCPLPHDSLMKFDLNYAQKCQKKFEPEICSVLYQKVCRKFTSVVYFMTD